MADGPAIDGSALVLSHWPNSGTPWSLKRDLSAEIAFAYLDDESAHVDPAAVTAVTNDHLDVDGFVSVFVLTHPDAAQERRELLTQVAAAGDFACRASDTAANIAFAIGGARAVAGKASVADQYRGLLDAFVDIADSPREHEALWREERDTVDAHQRALDAGDIRIEEPRGTNLAIVWLPEGWPGGGTQRGVLQRDTPVHPMAVHRRTERWQIAYVDPYRRDYRLVYRFESWVQLMSRTAGRVDLRPAAAALTRAEPNGGEWIANGRKTFIAWLRRRDSGPSDLGPEQFVTTVIDTLANAPITWTPYDARG